MKGGETSRTPLGLVMLAPTSVVGGIATWTRYLLDRYDRKRLKIHVIDNGKRYEAIGKEKNPRGVFLGVLNSFNLLFKMVKAVLVTDSAVVYLTCSGYWSFFTRDLILILVSKCMGQKVIIHLRGGHIEAFCGHGRLSRTLSLLAMSYADRIVAVSRDMEARIRGRFPTKTEYLPNMLGSEVQGMVRRRKRPGPGGTIRALHMAWQSPAKGSYEIIEACALLKERLPGLVCDLVGKAAPEHEAVILRMIRDRGLEGRVQLRREVTGKEKWDYFNAADIFLFPSHTEGFPNVILEAMCFGIPIIASKVGNIREMVGWKSDGEAAVILETLDPISVAELSDSIFRVVSDTDLQERLGENGRRRVQQRYLVEAVIPEIEDLILRTVTGG